MACHTRDACGAQCAQRLSSSQGESHHRACEPWRKCHWRRWCSCTRERRASVACDVRFPWNMTRILATRAKTLPRYRRARLRDRKRTFVTISNMLCRAKLQPPHGKEVEHTFRWSVRRVPWHRVRDAHHMQPVTRETRSSQATGTHRQLKWHRLAMPCRVVGRLEREEGGGRFASQIPETSSPV